MNANATRTFHNKTVDAAQLITKYEKVRKNTEEICAPLEIEDYILQAMPEASPAKWHLSHVSWFVETFLLMPDLAGYREVDPRYQYIFNSYYNAVGEQFSRPHRGNLSRPTVAQVYEYRAHVDDSMVSLY